MLAFRLQRAAGEIAIEEAVVVGGGLDGGSSEDLLMHRRQRAGRIGIAVFFFSSRRRHTRSLCDWSSDVCSSDLPTISRWKRSITSSPISTAPHIAGPCARKGS